MYAIIGAQHKCTQRLYEKRPLGPLAASGAVHVGKDLTSLTGNRQTDKPRDRQTDRQTEGQRHRVKPRADLLTDTIFMFFCCFVQSY